MKYVLCNGYWKQRDPDTVNVAPAGIGDQGSTLYPLEAVEAEHGREIWDPAVSRESWGSH